MAGLAGYPEPQTFDDAASIVFAMPFGSRGALRTGLDAVAMTTVCTMEAAPSFGGGRRGYRTN